MSLNFRTLDLNLLRVFDAVMEEGSLTRAAGRLAMTQPAVSHALKRLRLASGYELFTRHALGMHPTPQAQSLWPQVRGALTALRQALAPADFDPNRDTVQLRMAMADATAALLAPPLISVIERDAAQVNLRLMPLTTRDPRRLLEADEVDVAVGFFPELVAAVQAQGQDSSLRYAGLYQTRYVCVMRRGHPLAQGPLTLAAFCQAPHLLVSFSGKPYGYVDQALAALGQQRRIVLTVNQFFTAGQVVARSNLLTVLPLSFISATGADAELVTRELPMHMAPVQVGMLWHLRRDADAPHRWLRQQLVAAAAAAPTATINPDAEPPS